MVRAVASKPVNFVFKIEALHICSVAYDTIFACYFVARAKYNLNIV